LNSNTHRTDRVVGPILDGVSTNSESSECVEVVNPSNGRHLLTIPAGCDADVDNVVTSARRAFEDGRWSDAPPTFRKRTMHRLADLVEAHSATLDALDAEEMGKPIAEPWGNAASAAGVMRFYAESVDKVMGDVYGSDKYSFALQRRVPRGVVAAVTPWNFPTTNAVLKVAPALAAGNCVVLKPSELSSRSAIHLAHLALEAGLPPGALNIVPGLGKVVGRALGLHKDVDLMTFTGSTVVGKQMLMYAGQSNMKVVVAECGGKSPHIVFADVVDLDSTSTSIARLLLTNQGQLCVVGSRLVVQRSIQTIMLEKIAAQLQKIRMGDALDPKTTFGPLASIQQLDRVMNYIATAEPDGARLVTGGRRALLDSNGYFVEPTIFADVPPQARIGQEEIFGPVLSVMAFEDESEAIRIANGTPYGLGASVWTTNLSTGMRMAKAIRSSVLVNACPAKGEGPGHAFSTEPIGQSGIGTEGGMPGLETYLRRQLVWFNHA
jgi:acyl-CoA reductase-like NAD-dependent aldehyde dehydrogenase